MAVDKTLEQAKSALAGVATQGAAGKAGTAAAKAEEAAAEKAVH